MTKAEHDEMLSELRTLTDAVTELTRALRAMENFDPEPVQTPRLPFFGDRNGRADVEEYFNE